MENQGGELSKSKLENKQIRRPHPDSNDSIFLQNQIDSVKLAGQFADDWVAALDRGDENLRLNLPNQGECFNRT